MPKEKNIKIVQEIKEKFEKAKSVVFVDYLGLSSDDVNEFRQKIKETDSSVVVAKNTLIKKAIEEQDNKEISKAEKDLEGPTMAIFSFSDPISPIKVVYEFAKKFELPKTKSAIIEGIYTTSDQVEALKDIPSKEELLGRFVGSIASPISKFVFVLGGIQSKFVFAVNAIAQKRADPASDLEGGAN